VRRTTAFFIAPRQIEIREEIIDEPADGQVLVQVERSAISAGTEMLLYRGELPDSAGEGGDAISDGLTYPTAYGYCAVGKVVQVSRSSDREWIGRRVLGFEPHTTHFVTDSDRLLLVPPELDPEDAVFLPNLETAVNLVHDAAPLLGERVMVLGQGVVGLACAALFREFPLDCLTTADRFALRRQASQALGVTAALDPDDSDFRRASLALTGASADGYDVAVELTGSPGALDHAVALTAFSGRVIIGSWYGRKKAAVELGGRFHRSRIKLIASQVSTIAPELGGRWDKSRRFRTAWEAIRRIEPRKWITHRFPIGSAAEAYRRIDSSPESSIQVIFTYPD
jgi:2-desacetyl-2-hydroxyethyl bacteriochlorophyllide A dehydrogenase